MTVCSVAWHLRVQKKNPIEAAKLVTEWISPGEVQNEAAISVLHQWALRDPNAALEWAQLFPEETLRDRALKEMVNTFAKPPEWDERQTRNAATAISFVQNSRLAGSKVRT